MVLCAVIGELVYSGIVLVLTSFSSNATWILLLRVCCVIALYISYRKHSKNVMKGMMGALLMGQLISAILFLSDPQTALELILVYAYLVLSLLLFINHFTINANRQASPNMVLFNQIILILIAIVSIVGNVLWIENYSSLLISIALIVEIPGIIGMNASIVCVESRLDAYRQDREAAGWTEEAGYPKGYVHEYQKK